MSTRFFTNKNGNTLIRKFEGVLTNNPMVKNLDAVVGFLCPRYPRIDPLALLEN